jgi:hypothetical protein
MSRIWAVASHMLSEAIRTKIAVVFIAIILVLLTTLPFTVVGDGVTLKSRGQSFLAYSLGSVGLLLSLLTVFVSCGTLASEIREKHVFMVASKPIPRWQFFAGKWLGIVLLNAGLLLLSGVLIWGFTRFYIQTRPTFTEDRLALENEVLTVRHGARVDVPDMAPLVEERVRRLREEGRLDSITQSGRRDVREAILQDLRSEFRSLRPGEHKDYVFRNLLVDPSKTEFIYLRLRPKTPTGVDDLILWARWQCGDRNDVNTMMPVREGEYVVDRFYEEPISASAVNKDGELHLRIQNLDHRNTFTFEDAESLELLYDIGTFHWNLVRALTIIWCRLAFLAALGLLLSTFLSFPVACMVAFMILAVAVSSGFLMEAMAWAGGRGIADDPLWILGPVLRPAANAMVWLVPDFSKVDPVGTVVAGRVVTLTWVIQSLVVLVFFQGLVLGLLGCVIFTRRELAQVTS